MNRELARRLRALEDRPKPRRPSKHLTDDDWNLLIGLYAFAVIDKFTEWQPGEPVLPALYRGIERALWKKDVVSPIRDCFLRRLEFAAVRAITGRDTDSILTVDPENLRKVVSDTCDRPGANEIDQAIAQFRDDHPEWFPPNDPKGHSRIERDGRELANVTTARPDDAPPAVVTTGWCGQGFEAATVFWQSQADTPSANGEGQMADPPSFPHRDPHMVAP